MKNRSLFIILLWASMPAGSGYGQVPPPPLQGVQIRAEVTRDDRGVFWYTYTVTNPPSNALEIALMAIDMSAPMSMTDLCCWGKLPSSSWYTTEWRNPTTPSCSGCSISGEKFAIRDFKAKYLPFGVFAPEHWDGAPIAGGGEILVHNPTARFSTPSLLAGLLSDIVAKPIYPGQTLGGFKVTSYYLPGIRDVSFHPDVTRLQEENRLPEDWLTSSVDSDEQIREKEDKIAHLGYLTQTVGPRPPTERSGVELTDLILEFLDRGIALGWLPDAGWREARRQQLQRVRDLLVQENYTEAEAVLNDFLQAVVQGTPQQRSSEAYALLYFNGEALLEGWVRAWSR